MKSKKRRTKTHIRGIWNTWDSPVHRHFFVMSKKANFVFTFWELGKTRPLSYHNVFQTQLTEKNEFAAILLSLYISSIIQFYSKFSHDFGQVFTRYRELFIDNTLKTLFWMIKFVLQKILKILEHEGQHTARDGCISFELEKLTWFWLTRHK